MTGSSHPSFYISSDITLEMQILSFAICLELKHFSYIKLDIFWNDHKMAGRWSRVPNTFLRVRYFGNIQACNQDFFKAREIPWNKGSSIKISSTTRKTKVPLWKILKFIS